MGVYACMQTTLNHWGRPVEGGSALAQHDNDWTRTQVSIMHPSTELWPWVIVYRFPLGGRSQQAL